MSNFKRLITIYVSTFFFGLIMTLALFTFIAIYITKDELVINPGQSIEEENGALGKIIKKAKASNLEISPPIIQSEEYVSNDVPPVYHFDKYQMTVIDITGQDMDYFYFKQKPPKISSVAQKNGCKIAVNASYFAGNRQRANHVGLLSILGKLHVPLGIERQLTHVAVFNREGMSIEYFDVNNYKSNPTKSTLEFQTGPLVLDDGKVQSSFIKNSKNGMESHKRLLLATNKSNQTFLIVVRDRADLVELASYLKGIDLFGKEPDVINLDGGSSVALWSKNNPEVNYNAGDTLPLVICVR